MTDSGLDLTRSVPTDLTCPTCHGVLSSMPDLPIPTYRCRTGHLFWMDSLIPALEDDLEETLWTALRVLQEAADAERRLAEVLRGRGEQEGARGAGQRGARAYPRIMRLPTTKDV